MICAGERTDGDLMDQIKKNNTGENIKSEENISSKVFELNETGKITQSEENVLGLNKSERRKKKKSYTILDKEPLMLSATLAHLLEMGDDNMEEDYLEEIKQLDPKNKKWKTQQKRIKKFNISKYLIG